MARGELLWVVVFIMIAIFASSYFFISNIKDESVINSAYDDCIAAWEPIYGENSPSTQQVTVLFSVPVYLQQDAAAILTQHQVTDVLFYESLNIAAGSVQSRLEYFTVCGLLEDSRIENAIPEFDIVKVRQFKLPEINTTSEE